MRRTITLALMLTTALALATQARADHRLPEPIGAKNGLFKPGVTLAGLERPSAEPATKAPVLLEGMGPRRIEVTTRSGLAQRYFDQGLAWVYGFNHKAAIDSFRAAQSEDPTCAMCYWGEALALGPNINAPMDEKAARPAFAAVSQASALGAAANPLERALIGALAKRYTPDPKAERSALDRAYATAMGEVHDRHPNEIDVAVLYAESLMDLQPWDYWQADGKTPKGNAAQIVNILEKALAADPDHPHAIHLYIHAVEATADPRRAEHPADRLADLMPAAGHLVHMPAHIYYRIGRYADSFETNRKAVAADEAYMAVADLDPIGIYPYGYYPHNVHFMLVSAQMAGAGGPAIEAAVKLDRVMSDEVADAVPWVQAIKTAPLTAHALFSSPADIAALADPGGHFPFVQAFWHYAQAIGALRGGDTASAAEHKKAIDTLLAEGDLTPLVEGFVPAPELLRIASLVVEGRLARAEGDLTGAIAALEQATAIAATLAYMEPPYWHYPVSQTLAATYLMAGDAAAAERLFRAALAQAPANGWALFGLAEALEAQGKDSAATLAQLDEAWLGDRALLEIDRL